MEKKLEQKEDIYSEIERNLEENIQDILTAYAFEKERQESMRTIDIPSLVQKSLQEKDSLNSIISTEREWEEAIAKASNGTILKVDRAVLVSSINKQKASTSAQYLYNLDTCDSREDDAVLKGSQNKNRRI